MKLLIANGKSDFCEEIKMALKPICQPGDIRVTGDAFTAMDMIKSERPDVVLLEMKLTRGHGLDILEGVERDPRKPALIVFTDYPSSGFRKRCEKLGATGFFSSISEFDAAIDRVSSLAVR